MLNISQFYQFLTTTARNQVFCEKSPILDYYKHQGWPCSNREDFETIVRYSKICPLVQSWYQFWLEHCKGKRYTGLELTYMSSIFNKCYQERF